MRFLSEEWAKACTDALAAHEGFQKAAAGVALGLQFVVSDAPDGDAHYYMNIADDAGVVALGALENADATVKATYPTAVSLSKGELNVQAAFISGKLKVEGSLPKLMMNQNALNQYAAAVAGMDLEY
jgi:putative sterol carrier protein